MKRTLFITALVAACVGVHAETSETPAVYQQWGAGTFVATDITVSEANKGSYVNGSSTFDGGTQSGGVNIGHCLGDGSLTLTEGVSVSTPNNLYIGGKGYWNTTAPGWYSETGHDGTVTVKDGSTLSVGVSQNPYPAGARLYVGTSQATSKGALIADGGNINANVETSIGGGNSEGYLILRNGSIFSTGVRGSIQTDKAFFQVGVDAGSSGHVEIDNSGLYLFNLVSNNANIPTYTYLGFAGKADVSISNGGYMGVANYGVLMMGVYETASCTMTVGEGSLLDMLCTSYVGYEGEANLLLDKGALARTGKIIVGNSGAKDCAIVNNGDMQVNGDIELNNNSTLFTGVVTVSNRENEVDDGSGLTIGCDYNTHIAFNDASTQGVSVKDGANVVVGATLEGGDNMQYLTKADMADIDEAVLAGLGLTEASGITVSNRIGRNISMQYTTDDVNDEAASRVVSLAGGKAIIHEGNEEHEGTIGSYINNVNETKAHIRMAETVPGSSAVWEGGNLKTVATETTLLEKSSSVDVTKSTSKLVVVENSTLDNQGVINGAVEVDGTLKGTGAVNGTVAVTSIGRLVIGNSPGSMTLGSLSLSGTLEISVDGVDTPADATNVGWGSGTYSQLILTGGRFDLANGAVINILFGGDNIFDGTMGKEVAFDMAIVTGISGMTIGGVDAIADGALTASAVQSLVDSTFFDMTSESLGIPTVTGVLASFTVSDVTYYVEEKGAGEYALHVKGNMTIPEPATATLSLLALAGLCARRRRKH